MKTLLVLNAKGGSGKTTVARNMAVAARQAGLSVATLDTDPQGSLTHWWKRRPDDVPGIEHFQQPMAEITAAPSPIDGIDLLVVDTPTAIEAYPDAAGALVDAADLVLLPARATPEDLLSVTRTMRFVRTRNRPAAFVLNGVRVRVREVTDARRQLAGIGEVAPVDLPDLAEVYRTFTAGLGVLEAAGARSAADWDALWRYAADRLGIER